MNKETDLAESSPIEHKERIYLSPPHMGELELEFVLEAFRTNWISTVGPHVDAFEQEFAAFHGGGYAVALASGTAAIHLSLRLLNLNTEDEVYCSTLTFAASANPIVYEHAKPVFLDSDRTSWNMDPQLLEDELNRAAKIGKKPRAVVVVDLYGQCADLGAIADLCRRHEVPLIEDAAEALGADYRGRPAGTFGWTNAFSFNGNKIITTAGGGMLLTEDPKVADRIRHLATQARDPAPHYQHSHIGFNYRLSNILAGVGRGQLAVLRDRVEARRAIFQRYQHAFAELDGIVTMPEAGYGRSNRWLTCILIDPKRFGADATDVREWLQEHNIESRPLWKPLHMQPVFSDCRCVGGRVAEDLFQHGLCLPSGSALAAAQIDRIATLVRNVPKKIARKNG